MATLLTKISIFAAILHKEAPPIDNVEGTPPELAKQRIDQRSR